MTIIKRLEKIESSIQSKFEEVREKHKHKGSRGSNVEEIVKELLRTFLPPRYRIGDGEIIDSYGGVSNQCDVIITNEYQPYWNELSSAEVFIIEGVAAIGEIKSVLTTAELVSTLDKCVSAQSLERRKDKTDRVTGSIEAIHRWVDNKPFFLFAFESQITIDKISETVCEYNQQKGVPFEKQIDAVFVLGRGYYLKHGTESGIVGQVEGQSKPYKGYLKYDDQEKRVVYMLLTYLSVAIMNVDSKRMPITFYLLDN